MHFIPSRHTRRGLMSLVCAALFAFSLTVWAEDTPAATDVPTETVTVVETDTPVQTATSVETATPEATSTPVETATPEPSATPVDTETPVTPDVTLEFTNTPSLSVITEGTPTNVPWPTPTLTIPYAYNANFNGTQFPAELSVDTHWTLANVPGGQAVQSNLTEERAGISYLPAMFEQGRIEAFFAINQGSGGLVWGSYTVEFSPPSSISLSYNGTTLQSATLDSLNSDWNYVQLTVMPDAIRVAVNGVDKITAPLAAPLIPSVVGLWAAPNSVVRIDNFAIYGTPTSVPMTPAPSVTPVPSVTPSFSATPTTVVLTATLVPTSTSTSAPVSIPAEPVFTSHSMFSRVTTVRPTLIWAPVPGAESYEVAVVDAQTGVDYAPHQSVTATQFTPSYNLQQKNTSFYVRAGNALGWSNWSHVILNVVLGDTPAYGSLVKVIQPAFTWTVVPGATNYTLQVDNDQDFSSPVIDQTLTATSYTPTAAEAFSTPGIMYFWRVAASNLAYPEPDHILNFTTGTAIAGQPVITSPQWDVAVNTVRPTITWEALPGATSYEVAIVDSDTSLDLVPREIVTDTHFTPAINLPQKYTLFYVRGGGEEGWSDWAFVYAPVVLGDSPAQDSSVETSQPTFTWAVVPDATSYTLQVDNNPDFSSPQVEQTTTDTSYTLTAGESLASGSRYFWRVAASNLDYPPAVFARAFNIGFVLPTQPVITSLDADVNGLVNTVRPTIIWNAVPGATRYEVAVVDFETGIDYAPHESVTDTQFTVPYNLPQRSISFYVRAGNASDTDWSEWTYYSLSVALGNLPENYSTVPTTRPTFTWNAVPDATAYGLQVDIDPNFSNPLIDRVVTGTSYTLTADEALSSDNGNYFWRVTTLDLGYPMPWFVRTFTIHFYAPFIISPENESYVDNVRPTLTWEPVPGATSYEVAVVDTETGLDLAPHQTVSGTQFTPSYNLPQKNIGFFVRAMNDTLTSVWTYHALNIILGNTPAQGITLATTRPNFKWSAVPGASNYTLQVDDDYDFSSPLVERTLSGRSYTLTAAEALPNQTVYYWRVAASNVAYPAWGLIFAVDVPAPAAPVVTSPLPEATLDTLRPTVKWQAVPGATRYEVDVYEPDFIAHYGPYAVGNTTQFKLPANVPQNNLFLMVRAGNDGAWSDWTTVGITVVLGTTPVYDAIVPTARPTFKWSAVTGATNYSLQIDDDFDFSSPLLERTVNGTSYTLTAAEALTNPAGRYYWRVASSNIEYPGWWLARTFINGAIPVPTALYTGEGESTTPKTLFNGAAAIVLHWTPPTPAPYSYDVQFSNTSDFAVVFQTATTIDPWVFYWADGLPEGKIYWRVRSVYALESYGVSAWSGSKSFTVDLTPPPSPVAQTPTAGEINTARPTFSWTSSAGADHYVLDVYDLSTWTLVPGFPKIVNGTSYTLPTNVSPLPQAGYSWLVYAVDAAGNASYYSEEVFFRIFSGLTPTPAQSLTDATPRFTWRGVSGTGAAQWRLEIATTPDMGSIIYTSPNLAASATSFTLPNANALPAGVYYWRVLRITEAGTWVEGRELTIAP